MSYAQNRFPKKRRVNITLSEDLIDGAKRQGVNLSDLIERAIEREIRTGNLKAFCDAHKPALTQMSERIERDGTFGENHGVIRKYMTKSS